MRQYVKTLYSFFLEKGMKTIYLFTHIGWELKTARERASLAVFSF